MIASRPRRTSGSSGSLAYRRPFDWAALLGFLAGRAIPGVEQIADGVYRRTVALAGVTGWLELRPDGRRAALRAVLSPSLAAARPEVLTRLRALGDLDAQPALVTSVLHLDPLMARLMQRRPGLRVPGAFDGFELAMRAVLGQQVSVKGASTLAGRLVARFGAPLATGIPGLDRAFPTAAALATVAATEIAAIGLPGARAATIRAVACACATGGLRLDRGGDPAAAIAALQALPGIGPWTAHYLAMRALGWADAFPAGDLALRKALGGVTATVAEQRAERWRPWRAYAALHLWASLADGATP